MTPAQLDYLLYAADAIDKSLRKIAASLETIAASSGPRPTSSLADEIDLAAPVNDPEVKLEPTKGANKWSGESMKGKHFSECPADYLDRLALMFKFMADNPKEGKEKFRTGNLLDAARARAWAKAVREREAKGSEAGSAPGFVD